MRVKRKDLPNLFKPIYKRVARINAALSLCGCGARGCSECRLCGKNDCYNDITKEIEEVNRLMGGLANGVKKMD